MTLAIRAILAIMGLVSAARGIDYVTGNDYLMRGDYPDGVNLPIFWGIASIVVAVMALYSAATSCKTTAVNAGVAGMAVSVMYAVQIFQMRMLPLPWPPEDTRLVTDHLGHAAIWLLIAVTVFYRGQVVKRRTELLEEARE